MKIFDFSFSFGWPIQKDDSWKSYWDKTFSITPNRFLEFQLMDSSKFIGIDMSVSDKEDHAGLNINLALFGYEFDINFRDSRHWNYDENRWFRYDEDPFGS